MKCILGKELHLRVMINKRKVRTSFLYRREYLNLEKWLTDKIREHSEIFVAACVKFLQRKVPNIMGPGLLKVGEIQVK